MSLAASMPPASSAARYLRDRLNDAMAHDAFSLLGPEDVVGVRDLEQQGAGRDGHRIGTRRLVFPRGFLREEGADRLDAHGGESNSELVILSEAKDLLSFLL